MIYAAEPRNSVEITALVELARNLPDVLLKYDVAIVQAALQPHESVITACLLEAGYWKLSDLAYMHAAVPTRAARVPPPESGSFETWTEGLREAFTSTLMATYEGSMDCPALHALREPRDVIESHKATGLFDPSLWFVLKIEHRPAGVLLLNRIPELGCLDLVYLGVMAGFRGRGLGRYLVRHALACCSDRGLNRVTLAVDLANAPAVALYRSQSFVETSQRTILMRGLSPQNAAASKAADSLSTGFPS